MHLAACRSSSFLYTRHRHSACQYPVVTRNVKHRNSVSVTSDVRSRRYSRSNRSTSVQARQIEDAEMSKSTTAVVVVDHGSRRETSNRMLQEFVDLYRQTSGRKIVEGAHMEIAEPTIADAVSKCASAGASTIIVAPYFLSRGRHIQEDIPALVAAAQQQHPGVKCVVAEPIGLDPLMAELIEMRVINASAAQSVAQAGEA